MSERPPRQVSRRSSLRSVQSSQMSDRSSLTDDDDEATGFDGDNLSFDMRSVTHSFLSVGYRQDDSDWDVDDGRRSVRSGVSASSSRRLPRHGTPQPPGARTSRTSHADGNDSLEVSLNSLRSSRRSSRRRVDATLDGSFHSRASGRSVGSRRSARRANQQKGNETGEQNGSFISDGVSEDLVTSGFAAPLFALGPGTFVETRSVDSSRRRGGLPAGAAGETDANARRGGGAAGTSGNFDGFETDTAGTTRQTRRSTRTGRRGRPRTHVPRNVLLRKVNVPLKFVTEQLANRQARIRVLREFFLFIPLLIMFCFFAEFHITNIPRCSLSTQAIRQQYERRGFPSDQSILQWFRQEQSQQFRATLPTDRLFRQVRGPSDMAEFYMNSILYGTFIVGDLSSTYTGGGSLMDEVGNDAAGGDGVRRNMSLVRMQVFRLLGALRIRAARVKPYTAPIQENLYEGANANFSREAWSPKVSSDTEDKTPFVCEHVRNPIDPSQPLYVYRSCDSLSASSPFRTKNGRWPCGGYMFDIPFDINHSIAQEFVSAVVANCSMLDLVSTRFTAVEFFTYVPSLDSYTQVKFVMEVSAGGLSTTQAVFRPFFVYTPVRQSQAVYTAVVMAYTTLYLAVFIVGVVRAARAREFVRWLTTWYNWVDLGVLGCAFAAFAAFFQWMGGGLRVQDDIRWPMAPRYPLFLDHIETLYALWTDMSSATTILLFVRLFRFVSFWTPLTILWRTVMKGLWTIFATLVMYVLLLTGYALCGWAVFGPFSGAFRTIPNAFTTLALGFISDTWYYPIDNVNEQFQFLFFWSYCLCVFSFALVALCSIFSTVLAQVARRFAVSEVGAVTATNLFGVVNHFHCRSLQRLCASVLGIRHDDELMQRLIKQLHNFNRVQQDYYLYGVREKIEREVDERMREFRERRAGAASVFPGSHTTGDDNEASGFSSGAGDSIAHSADHLALSLGSGSAGGAESDNMRQMLSTLAHSMSLQMGSSLEASDGGLAALFDLSATTPEGFRNEDEETALAHITAHVQSQYVSQLVPTDIEVRFTDWARVVPSDLYNACGGHAFFEHLWIHEIVPAWTEHMATPEEKERTEFIHHTQTLTRAILSAQLAKVKLLDATLRKLEAHVTVAQDVLDAKNADDRESSDGEEI